MLAAASLKDPPPPPYTQGWLNQYHRILFVSVSGLPHMIIMLRKSLFSRKANSHPSERRSLQASLTQRPRRSHNLRRCFFFFLQSKVEVQKRNFKTFLFANPKMCLFWYLCSFAKFGECTVVCFKPE